MKIKEIRTRVIEWRGKTVPLPPHFCTNPMDAVSPMLSKATMGTFTSSSLPLTVATFMVFGMLWE